MSTDATLEHFDRLSEQLLNLRGYFDRPGLRDELDELNAEMEAPGFWDDPATSKRTMRQRSGVERQVKTLARLDEQRDEIDTWRELLREAPEEAEDDAAAFATSLQTTLDELDLAIKLSGPDDGRDALLAIHPGAGGTESADWASMLLRMYLRYGEHRDFRVELLDRQDSDEAGIKSATFAIRGENAYGYLKGESGVHRLVRISPFDAASRRHTSFASVYVYPDIDDEIEIDIQDKDLRIDTYRSSGAGGQHVNVTDSAVRITHLPTNIVVTCQNERSQIKNRATAMKILRARLYDRELKKREEEQAEREGAKKEIAWGSQIRSYVLHPYRMVKDHRTSIEVGDADRVLDGDLDAFIEGYLKDALHSEAGADAGAGA
ncbi:MAG: peptide chain release factor 2 [Acidobacteriota bacterium]